MRWTIAVIATLVLEERITKGNRVEEDQRKAREAVKQRKSFHHAEATKITGHNSKLSSKSRETTRHKEGSQVQTSQMALYHGNSPQRTTNPRSRLTRRRPRACNSCSLVMMRMTRSMESPRVHQRSKKLSRNLTVTLS